MSINAILIRSTLRAVTLALGLIAGVSAQASVSPPPSSWPAGSALSGKSIYPGNCTTAGCHTGTSNATDTLGKVGGGASNPTKINNAILNGTMTNAALRALTAQQIADIAAYLANLNVSSSAPIAAAAPSTLTFASTTVGATSAAQTVTLSNTGTTALGPVAFAASGPYAVTPSTCTSGGTVAAGSSCTVTVAFNPIAVGAASGSLIFSHNASPTTTSVALSGIGAAAPVLAASTSPSTLTFTSTTIGATSAGQTVTLSNTGSAALTPLNFYTTGAFAVAAGTCAAGGSVAARGTCTVSVTFKPTATGSASGSLTFTHNASPSSTNVVLSGIGAAAPLPSAVVGPVAMSFVATTVGAASAAQTVTISNTGTAPLVVSGIASSDAAVFKVTGGSCVAGGSVTAGASCTVMLSFNPAAAGAASASLTIAHNASPNMSTVTLSGTGVAAAPGVSVSPSLLTFSQVTGTTSSNQTVTVSNTGSATLALSSIVIGGAQAGEFAKAPASSCGASVAAGASCSVLINFTPAATGARTASLTITHNAAGGSSSAALNGTGTSTAQPVISVNNNALTFSAQALGSSATQTVTVTNSGQANLVLSSVALSGAQSADYSLSGTCMANANIAVNQSCTLTVQFVPAAVGTRSASVNIASNATPVTIGLSGSATLAPAPAVTLTPTTQAFGIATVGAAAVSRTVTLTNSGSAALTLSAVDVTGAGFSGSSACGSTLAAGVSCAITLAFAPTSAVAYNGQVSVVSNAPGSPHMVALLGTGVLAPMPVLAWAGAATVAFSDTAVGATSVSVSLSLQNQGPGTVTLNSISASTGEFSIGGGCGVGATLVANATCSATVTFAPAQVGKRTASLNVTSNGTNPTAVSMTGSGVMAAQPRVTASTASLTFPPIVAGTAAAPVTVTLTNSGTMAVTIAALTLSSGQFTAESACGSLPLALAPGQSCQINVSVNAGDATVAGDLVDTLTVVTDVAGVAPQVELRASVSTPAVVASSNVGAGGCSVTRPGASFDPVLWLLLALAITVLWWRRGQR